MLGLVSYVKHDLEGVYTAELARGSISMLLAVFIYVFSSFGVASAYILIVALYGLRPLTGKKLFSRLINILGSLFLLISTLAISLYLGHNEMYFLQIILCLFLCSATVWALSKKPTLSGTVMFMSVFNVINFGMGIIDTGHEISIEALSLASLLGASCVFISVIAIPFHGFHWCFLINYCFYHELRNFCKLMSNNTYYESFTELPCKRKEKILRLQSSLMNITSYIRDPERQKLYQHILNSLMLISYWPTNSTDLKHRQLINNIRSQTFGKIYKLLLTKSNTKIPKQALEQYMDAEQFILHLQELPKGQFCNGEMINHTANVIKSLISLLKMEAKENLL